MSKQNYLSVYENFKRIKFMVSNSTYPPVSHIETVYIASPYSIGDRERNVAISIDCANALMDAGFYPFAPLLTHFWDLQHKRDYEDWLDYCLKWVARCDAVLRIIGKSKGADTEVAKAIELGIPVFYSIKEIMDYNEL